MEKINISTLKRRINKTLKEGGFKKVEKIGATSALHGTFPAEVGDYCMEKQTPPGVEAEHIIFPSVRTYEIVKVTDRFNVSSDEIGKYTMIFNYLGDPDAIALAISKKINREETINAIYDYLVNKGYGEYLSWGGHYKNKTTILIEAK